MLERHSCKDCYWCKRKCTSISDWSAIETSYVCDLFEDAPKVDIYRYHFCPMFKEKEE